MKKLTGAAKTRVKTPRSSKNSTALNKITRTAGNFLFGPANCSPSYFCLTSKQSRRWRGSNQGAISLGRGMLHLGRRKTSGEKSHVKDSSSVWRNMNFPPAKKERLKSPPWHGEVGLVFFEKGWLGDGWGMVGDQQVALRYVVFGGFCEQSPQKLGFRCVFFAVFLGWEDWITDLVGEWNETVSVFQVLWKWEISHEFATLPKKDREQTPIPWLT